MFHVERFAVQGTDHIFELERYFAQFPVLFHVKHLASAFQLC